MAGGGLTPERAERIITRVAARVVAWIGRHWLLLINVVMLLYLGLATLAPVLAHAGHVRGARVIYTLFSPLCHQLPERSFFLYGPQVTYTRDELVAMAGGAIPLRYTGDIASGFKMAICERCAAIYGAWFLAGLAFAFLRTRLRPLSLRWFVLLLVPIGVDGVGQLVRLWTSTWQMRMFTGALFSVAIVWLTYPYLDQGMAEMRADAARQARFRESP